MRALALVLVSLSVSVLVLVSLLVLCTSYTKPKLAACWRHSAQTPRNVRL